MFHEALLGTRWVNVESAPRTNGFSKLETARLALTSVPEGSRGGIERTDHVKPLAGRSTDRRAREGRSQAQVSRHLVGGDGDLRVIEPSSEMLAPRWALTFDDCQLTLPDDWEPADEQAPRG